jgi:hypothetical protein
VRVNDAAGVLKGYTITVLGPNQGQDNNNQQQPYAVTLAAGGYNLTADFGYTRTPGAIGDYIWNDHNGNGLQDEPANAGLNGVTVQLYTDPDCNGSSADGALLRTTVTSRLPWRVGR